MPYVSKLDESDLIFGISQDVDYVAASFVRNASDVHDIRTILDRNGGENIDIISKIENRQGVDNIDEIIAESNGIMVARGDMGVEIPYEELPAIQKDIIKKCYQEGKKVITATQMLEPMISAPRPTRAEISDVANAVFDGTSATMLSGETAVGKHPVEVIKAMALITQKAEENIHYQKRFQNASIKISAISDAVCYATCSAAHTLNATAILVVSQSGRSARMISRFRPNVPIIAAVTDEKSYQKLAINWGVTPVLAKMQDSTDTLFDHAIELAKTTGWVKRGDTVVITAGIPVGISGNTNIMKVQTLD
jgi:pyruvate kinase